VNVKITQLFQNIVCGKIVKTGNDHY